MPIYLTDLRGELVIVNFDNVTGIRVPLQSDARGGAIVLFTDGRQMASKETPDQIRKLIK